MHHYWDTLTETTILFQSEEWNPEAKKKIILIYFSEVKRDCQCSFCFSYWSTPLITPSFVIIDFKIRRRAAHLFICLSLQREGQRRKGGYLLVSAASKLRSKLRAKYLQREDTNTNILLTEKICPAYEHQRIKICAPRSLIASDYHQVLPWTQIHSFAICIPKSGPFLLNSMSLNLVLLFWDLK